MDSNSLSINDIEPYFDFKRFIIYDFLMLENLRLTNNYTYLETINYFYVAKSTIAPFINSNTMLVNKQFFLEEDYEPSLINSDDYPIKTTKKNIYLQRHVMLAYLEMIDDLELFDLYLFSGYRSFTRQSEIYFDSLDNNYVAKPGFSEHQTGLAIDISTLEHGLTENFKLTNEYELLIQKCKNYGFILRYPENKETITKYNYEPWHFRYVGKIAAEYIMDNNMTLEEYIYKNFEL